MSQRPNVPRLEGHAAVIHKVARCLIDATDTAGIVGRVFDCVAGSLHLGLLAVFVPGRDGGLHLEACRSAIPEVARQLQEIADAVLTVGTVTGGRTTDDAIACRFGMLGLCDYTAVPFALDRAQSGLLICAFTRTLTGDEVEVIGSITALAAGALSRAQALSFAQHELKECAKVERTVRLAEERLRALIGASSEVFYRMSADWTEMLHLEGGDFILDTDQRRTDWLAAYIYADDQAAVQARVRHSVETETTFEFEHRVIRVDGSVGWTSSRAVPVRDDAGVIIEWLGAAADITARKEAERALVEADERKDEFIAVLSHELRNPLAPIRYALPVLQGERLSPAASRATTIVARQVAHLTRLVDDLLDVSRITNGTFELECETVAISSVVTAAVEAASPGIAANRHTLDIAVPPSSVWLCVDAMRMTQVVTNLLNNSAKYTPRGGHIRLTIGASDEVVTLTVQDDGIGIPSDAITRVFGMFHQVQRDTDGSGGLGIGLALSKRIVEMHLGTIEVHSDGVGKGAEFTVRLPRAKPPATVDVQERFEVHRQRALKVLIVDDNADLVEMLATAVAGDGHEVRTALDGRSAVAAAMAYVPDVVLLDLGLPILNGYEVAAAIRKQPALAGTRLVAVTGWGQEDDRQRTAAAGFDVHLTKPTDPDDLMRLLQEPGNVR